MISTFQMRTTFLHLGDLNGIAYIIGLVDPTSVEELIRRSRSELVKTMHLSLSSKAQASNLSHGHKAN